MLAFNIIITSPHPQFTKVAQDVCQRMGVGATIIEAVLEQAAMEVELATRSNDIQVIISRGGTAQAIKARVDVPMVIAEANDFDVLRAFWQAKGLSNNIAFLSSAGIIEDLDLETVTNILSIKVKQYPYRDFKELKQQIAQANYDGAEVVVGGGQLGVQLAEAMGMYGVLIHSSRRTITQAVLRAKQMIEIRRSDQEYLEKIKSLMTSVDDAMLLIDNNGQILVANYAAERLLGRDFKPKTNQTCLHDDSFSQIFNDLSSFSAKVFVLGNVKYVVDKKTITSGSKNENLGAVIIFREVTKLQQLEQKIRREISAKGLAAKFSFEDIIGTSKVIKDAIEIAKRFGETDSTVLIYGESGTGKELFAQSMHLVSPRSSGPFVAINCAAIPENLLESELFGYEEGAFTGAKKGGKEGLFELAHGGTIFLDEIDKMPLSVQARLLRVLQEKEVMRLGGDRVIPIDARIISATNQNLGQVIRTQEFRSDLYYRLNVLYLKLPALRERIQDIVPLTNHFLVKLAQKLHGRVKEVPCELVSWMQKYSWPGNVRELENFLERYIALSKDTLFPDFLLIDKLIATTEQEFYPFHDDFETVTIRIGTIKEMEREIMVQLSERLGNNRASLARLLQVSRTTIWKKLNDDL